MTKEYDESDNSISELIIKEYADKVMVNYGYNEKIPHMEKLFYCIGKTSVFLPHSKRYRSCPECSPLTDL
jgi:hypothetical protein